MDQGEDFLGIADVHLVDDRDRGRPSNETGVPVIFWPSTSFQIKVSARGPLQAPFLVEGGHFFLGHISIRARACRTGASTHRSRLPVGVSE